MCGLHLQHELRAGPAGAGKSGTTKNAYDGFFIHMIVRNINDNDDEQRCESATHDRKTVLARVAQGLMSSNTTLTRKHVTFRSPPNPTSGASSKH